MAAGATSSKRSRALLGNANAGLAESANGAEGRMSSKAISAVKGWRAQQFFVSL